MIVWEKIEDVEIKLTSQYLIPDGDTICIVEYRLPLRGVDHCAYFYSRGDWRVFYIDSVEYIAEIDLPSEQQYLK